MQGEENNFISFTRLDNSSTEYFTLPWKQKHEEGIKNSYDVFDLFEIRLESTELPSVKKVPGSVKRIIKNGTIQKISSLGELNLFSSD